MRKTQKELKRQHVQLTKDKKAKEQQLTDLDSRAHDVQVCLACIAMRCSCWLRFEDAPSSDSQLGNTLHHVVALRFGLDRPWQLID